MQDLSRSIKCGSFCVSEVSTLDSYNARWSDDEIAAIRVALRRLTATRIPNRNDVEDLVQDTLLTMIRKHPGAELRKGPLVWSMGILRKKVGNYYRKAQRLALLVEKDVCSRQLANQSAPVASPEVTLFHEELESIVRESLEQLPSAQREAMELVLAGFDSGEIVKRLHPERYQNVINRIHRGRKRLARELAKYGYGPEAVLAGKTTKRCGRKPASGRR